MHLSFLFSIVVNLDAAMEELWKHFKLSDKEKGIMAVESHEVAISKQQDQFSILFTLQTTKDFNKEAFKSTCTSLWRSPRGVTIKEVGQNLFLAIFGSEEHFQEIIDKSQWSFDKRLILMKRFYGDISPAKVTFTHSLFWIRIFNTPIISMNKDVEAHSANEMGKLIIVDAPKSGLAWGPFLRIRVRIDITKPLMRGKMIQIENLDANWAVFKYERLPIFCYCCGLLGHQDCECPQLKTGCFAANEDDFQYGSWLCSIAPRGGRKKRCLYPSFSGTRRG